MNFDLDQDERALQAAIRDLCKGVFPMETIRSLESSGGVSEDSWRALADAGVFSLRLPESDGGAGLGMTAAVIVFEQLGRALVPGPLVGTHLAKTFGMPGQRVTFAHRDDLLISNLDSSDVVAVIDAEGVWLISQNGIAAESIAQPLDPLTPASRVSSLPQGDKVVDGTAVPRVRLEASALTAALLVGIASAETDLAVAYAKERRQFGRAIGSFQAVKHICADMLTRAEVARAAVYAAGVHLDGNGDGDTARAVTGAMLLASEAAFANGKACVQVHGGMGFTWEIDAHLYLKRAAALIALHGGADVYAEEMAAVL
ncbi:MAG TPA: acyl-CoA dehydrogenase family protein [Actinomycetota bacterium]|nr:acyl-CoA dehydrogenase family protein [Actinomycetota bacterium]